ncbi:MAG: hypothetical protein IK997_02180 [Bacilli bacterium]|nr:hypothetical protein [Bacilli bacterium]
MNQNTVGVNNQINVNNNVQTVNNVSTTNSNIVDEDKVLRVHRKVKKTPFVLLFLLSIGIVAFGVYNFLQSKDKYNNFVIIGADLLRTEKKYQAGVPYYLGTYRYVVDGKKYDYNNPTRFEGKPDLVIQIRYNPDNPKELYNRNETLIYIGVFSLGIIVFLVTFGVLISLTSNKEEKIVLTVVYDSATCVGGRKIYMKTINPDGTALPPENTEYYSYFTDKIEYFPVGRKVKFNLYKYNKSILTERFNDVIAIQVNDFKITDFIFL